MPASSLAESFPAPGMLRSITYFGTVHLDSADRKGRAINYHEACRPAVTLLSPDLEKDLPAFQRVTDRRRRGGQRLGGGHGHGQLPLCDEPSAELDAVDDLTRASGLHGTRRVPQHAGVDAIRIEGAHRLVQFSRRRRLFHDPIEVADVFAGFFDDPRVVVVARALVSGDHRARPQ